MLANDTHSNTAAINKDLGQSMMRLIERLYPICRSITGEGVRQSLEILSQRVPLKIHEIPTGTPVFDWTVPKEWNIRDAYIKDDTGKRLVDFHQSNLHVVSYSQPIHRWMTADELRPHLHQSSELPDAIPYRTTYYEETWGFCVTASQMQQLMAHGRDRLEVCIDSTLEPGALTYAECLIPGKTDKEVLFSCHVCHPSLCNDNLSGISVATELADRLAESPHRYSYRILFVPGTIGAITWLAQNRQKVNRIHHGLVLSLLGDPSRFHYKRSRRGTAMIDQVMEYLLTTRFAGSVLEFEPYGYDERQYCSPGFNLPVGSLSRSRFGTFAEYHTSADNLQFVQPAALAESLELMLAVVEILEGNRRYRNRQPMCEPQLGKRGLIDSLGGASDKKEWQMALLWVLNLSDGDPSLLQIAQRSGLSFSLIRRAASALEASGLLSEVSTGDTHLNEPDKPGGEATP